MTDKLEISDDEINQLLEYRYESLRDGPFPVSLFYKLANIALELKEKRDSLMKKIEELEAYIKNVDAALSYSGHLVAWFRNERKTLRDKYKDLALNNFDNMEGCADGAEFAKWEAYFCAFQEIANELSAPILLSGEIA